MITVPICILELDLLKIRILMKKADRTVEHGAVLQVVCHSQGEHVQQWKIVNRRQVVFLMSIGGNFEILKSELLTNDRTDRHVNSSKCDI